LAVPPLHGKKRDHASPLTEWFRKKKEKKRHNLRTATGKRRILQSGEKRVPALKLVKSQLPADTGGREKGPQDPEGNEENGPVDSRPVKTVSGWEKKEGVWAIRLKRGRGGGKKSFGERGKKNSFKGGPL